MKLDVNFRIARTHLTSRKRQTLIAALGVTIGIGMYIFTNALMGGFTAFSRRDIFKNTPHVQVYQADQISRPLATAAEKGALALIVNPSITTTTKRLSNPQGLMQILEQDAQVLAAAPQVNVDLFYTQGRSQLRGTGNGIQIEPADAMFDIRGDMVAGRLEDLGASQDGIVIGTGIARKLSLRVGDVLSVTSSQGVIKQMRVVGLFETGNQGTDETKSYLNMAAAQQLLRESPSYVTHIYVQISSPDSAQEVASQLQRLIPYKVEPWQVANANLLAADVVRDTMSNAVSMVILLVAAFGIYNILNMTITQKMTDIAILKAMGFRGRDIRIIFLSEALAMGSIGVIGGSLLGALITFLISQVYVGGPVGYFPISYSWGNFLSGIGLGLLITFGAGYFPSRKAASVDPVAILRR